MNPFSYEYYEKILREFQSEGYVISSFEEYDDANPKTVIMRHDVDYTLDGLIALAEIENRHNCSATYMLRVHADEYNLFAPSTYAVVTELMTLGHEIGLHFECMNVGRALQINSANLLKREKGTLEAILGRPINSCSEHRELSGLIHDTPLFDQIDDPTRFGFEHYAMSEKYAKDMKYLSDSNANWREGDPLQHINQHDRFQLLVHADWWFESDLLLKGPYYHNRSTHT